jgi:hypothetical protein
MGDARGKAGQMREARRGRCARQGWGVARGKAGQMGRQGLVNARGKAGLMHEAMLVRCARQGKAGQMSEGRQGRCQTQRRAHA